MVWGSIGLKGTQSCEPRLQQKEKSIKRDILSCASPAMLRPPELQTPLASVAGSSPLSDSESLAAVYLGKGKRQLNQQD